MYLVVNSSSYQCCQTRPLKASYSIYIYSVNHLDTNYTAGDNITICSSNLCKWITECIQLAGLWRGNHAATDETQQSQSSQGRTRRRRCWDDQSSLPDEYSAIQNIPALQKLHRLAVWLRSSSIHANLRDKEVGIPLGIDNLTR
jgi:hypothetical protein